MAVVKQLTVALENKPAQLAKLCGALAKAQVNLKALTVVDNRETCLVRMVPENASTARRVIKQLGLPLTTSAVVAHPMPAQAGSLAKATRMLSQAGLNIEYVYGSEPKRDGIGMCVFGVEDPKLAESVLKGDKAL